MSNDATSSFDTDVLIVGADPTGRVLALWPTKQGVRVRLIDKSDGPSADSLVLAVQARTLELHRQLDLADEVLAWGVRSAAGHPEPSATGRRGGTPIRRRSRRSGRPFVWRSFHNPNNFGRLSQ